MNREENGGERKTIEIQQHLLAHTLKNAAKKRPKKKEDDEELENLGEDLIEKRERKTRIRMNEQLGGNRRTQRYERKSLLREYRKKQEDLLKEGGGSGDSLFFSRHGGESKLIIQDAGSSGSSGGFKVDTQKGAIDDFSRSVDFINHLEEEIRDKANAHKEGGAAAEHHNYTVRKKPLLPKPEYSCLKGGSMPTFREWSGQQPPGGGHRATQRMGVHYGPMTPSTSPMSGIYSRVSFPENSHPVPPPPSAVHTSVPPPPAVYAQVPEPAMMVMETPMAMSPVAVYEMPRNSMVPPILTPAEKEAKEKLKEMHEKLKLQQLMREREEQEAKGAIEKRGKRKKTIRRKLHTGKINDRVSILIPNKTIRNRVHNTTQRMHQTSIQDIKKYLLKRGFIKVGTSAPHEILRKMYNDLNMLGGEVQNMNGENIVYNFKAGGGVDD